MSEIRLRIESLKDELIGFCISNSLSEEGLREIIKRHGLTPNDSNVSDYKFFRLACHNKRVTEGIIRCLLEYFPAAASATCKEGWTPLHHACYNKNMTLNIIQLLIDAAPDSVCSVNRRGWMPLHYLCYKKNLDETAAIEISKLLIEKCPEALRHANNNGSLPIHLACVRRSPAFCQVLVDAAPDSVRSVDDDGWTPIHTLCDNPEVDEATAILVLKLLMEKHPDAVRHADRGGSLPIHYAAKTKSPEFCRVLIDAYPGSEQIPEVKGTLPLHWACYKGSLPTVEYLYRLFPVAIGRENIEGLYPIHMAIGLFERSNPEDAVEIVKFLLNYDPNQKLIRFRGNSLLRVACGQQYNNSNIEAGVAALEVIKVLFDAHPEAIEDNRIATGIQRFHPRVRTFINRELVYSRQAKDLRLMVTPDSKGQLPLHTALQNNVRLGSIKLLVKGNPAALLSLDSSGALPLHIACQHHDYTDVVHYLVELDTTTLGALDRNGNTALHCACRGGKNDTITLLLEKYNAVSVSKRNDQEKLPIELLWESNAVEDNGSLKYTESVFRLLRSYPEMVAINNLALEQPIDVDQMRNVKKRKLDLDDEEETPS